MGNPIQRVDLKAYNRSTLIQPLVVLDSAGNAVMLMGYTAFMEIRAQPGSPVLFTATDANGRIVFTGTNTLQIYIPGTDIAAWTFTNAQYDLFVISPGGAAFAIARGAVTVFPDITNLSDSDIIPPLPPPAPPADFSIHVATMALLRLLDPSLFDHASLDGYFAAGDGGAGDFYYDPGSVLADDGGSVIKPTSVSGAGRWILIVHGEIKAIQFGIKADSTATVNGTDNSIVISNIQKFMALNEGLNIIFPQNEAQVVGYTKELQFRFINRAHLLFGSPFRNIATDSQKTNGVAFGSDPFVNMLAGEFVTVTSYQLPFPIATVLAGSGFVVLSTPALAAQFTIGGWAMVCGYDMQGGGYPPNYRYFERKKVIKANASTGRIDFETGLENAYYSSWYFYDDSGWLTGGGFTNRIGPAGIAPLDRGLYARYADEYSVENFTLLTNPADSTPVGTYGGEPYYFSSTVFFFGGHYAKITNPSGTVMVLGNSEMIEVINPQSVSFNPDKNNNRLLVQGGSVAEIFEGTGFNHIHAVETTIRHRCALTPIRSQKLDRCYFPGLVDSPISPAGFLYSQSCVLTENRFAYPVAGPLIPGWTPDENVGAPDQPGKFSCTVATTPTTATFTVAFGDGTFRIQAGIGTVLTRPSDNVEAIINRIDYVGAGGSDPSGYFLVSYTSNHHLAAADVLYYYTLQELRADGTVRLNAHARTPLMSDKRLATKYICPDDGIFDKTLNFLIRDVPPAPASNNRFDIDGILDEIEVVVTRAYTGAGSGFIYIFAGTPYGSTFPIQTINSKIVGRRLILPANSLTNNSSPAGTVILTPTLSPASVAANTTAEQLLSVPGLLATDLAPTISKPTAQAGLAIGGTRVAGAGSLGVTYINDTASPIVPTGGQVHTVSVYRPVAASPASEVLVDFGANRYIGLIVVNPVDADNPGTLGWDGFVRVQAARR